MGPRRLDRLNSLLKQVLSDVIHQQVRNPQLPKFITVTQVDVSRDLHFGKVFISVIGTQEEKERAVEILQHSAGFIQTAASKQIEIRYFPQLTFYLDESVEKQIRMEELIYKINQEREGREIGNDA